MTCQEKLEQLTAIKTTTGDQHLAVLKNPDEEIRNSAYDAAKTADDTLTRFRLWMAGSGLKYQQPCPEDWDKKTTP